MFNFTTLTVFNKINKHDLSDGRSIAKGANLIIGDTNDKPFVRIGNTRFNSELIEHIYMKKYTGEAYTKVTFDMSAITPAEGEDDALGRIILYIGLSMNSQDSEYANPWVYKGKPFYVEFKVFANNAAKTAKEAKRVVEKFALFETDEKLLEVSVDGTKLTISGVNGYQQIRKAVLQLFDPEAIPVDCCTTNGDFVDKVIGVPAVYSLGDTTDGIVAVNLKNTASQQSDPPVYHKYTGEAETETLADNEVPIYPGIEAFCDYNWIIHNLRLPTVGNMNYFSHNKDEMPAVGQTYTLFTIIMKDTRDRVSGESVGMRTTSVTTHVLYVAGDPGTKSSTDTTTPAGKVLDALKDLATAKIEEIDNNTGNPYNLA